MNARLTSLVFLLLALSATLAGVPRACRPPNRGRAPRRQTLIHVGPGSGRWAARDGWLERVFWQSPRLRAARWRPGEARAIEHPWIFREVRALLDRGVELAPPTVGERLRLGREHLRANVAVRGEPRGVFCTRRHLGGYLKGLPGAAALRRELFGCERLEGCLAMLHRFELALAA